MKKLPYKSGRNYYSLFVFTIVILFSCKKENTDSPRRRPQTPSLRLLTTRASKPAVPIIAMYSVGTYLDYPTDSDWSAPLNLRPVIGTYDLAPDTVRKQLAEMYANGQRKIAIDLWYLDFSLYGNPSNGPLNGHIVNSKLGKLMPQHESNLKSALTDIEECRI